MCLCKLVMTHDSLLIVRFVFFPTLTVVGLPVLRKPRVAFQFTICLKKALPVPLELPLPYPKTFILEDGRQDRGREQTRGRRSPRQEDSCPGQRGMLLAKAAFGDHGDTKKAAPKGRLCCAGSSRQAGRQPCRSIFFRLRRSGRPVRHRAHRSGQPDHPGCGR